MAKRGPKGPSKYTTKFINKEATALVSYAKKIGIPFECDFANKRGYYSELLSRWAKINPKFYQALKKMKDIQMHRLIVGGLANRINTAMAIFTLKNVAGWGDKQVLEHKGQIMSLAQIVNIVNGNNGDNGNNNNKQARVQTGSRINKKMF